MDILLTGRMLSSEEALQIGLINRIVEPAALAAEALALARQVASNGTLAVQRSKEAVLRTADLPLAEAYELESELGVDVFRSEEAAEGLARFAARR